MKNKKIFFLLSILLMISNIFCINSYAVDDSQCEIFLCGFGDDYEDDDFLTLHNTRTCYVMMNNIPLSEKENIRLTIADENIAEIQEITYEEKFNPVITAKIKGKKLGTTDIIASLVYNGVNYTSKITTTVRQSNYRIGIEREDDMKLEGTSMKKGEKLKLVTILVSGMAYRVGDISSKGVIWSSNDESVVNVNDNGLVTAIKEGKATITAKYKTPEDEIVTDSCDIEVKGGNDPTLVPSQIPTQTPDPPQSEPVINSKQEPLEIRDKTIAQTILPKAGKSITMIICIGIIIMIFITVGMYKKYKNFRDIK